MPTSGRANTIIVPKDASYPPSPYFLEPIVTLTWAAAFTQRVRLGTSVLVLPMRHPLPLAKELASLQCLSEGRLILGAGVGWLEAEFAALGVPFRERGRRMDESLALLRALWSEDPVSFEGRHIAAEIREMRMLPQPSPPIPIWIGGGSEAAIRRALAQGEGWHGSRLSPAAARPVAQRLKRESKNPGFVVSLRANWEGKDEDELKSRLFAYHEAGIDHLLIQPTERTIDEWLYAVERVARAGEGLG